MPVGWEEEEGRLDIELSWHLIIVKLPPHPLHPPTHTRTHHHTTPHHTPHSPHPPKDAEYDHDAGLELAEARSKRGDAAQQAQREKQRQIRDYKRLSSALVSASHALLLHALHLHALLLHAWYFALLALFLG